jgi:hypothetical protein
MENVNVYVAMAEGKPYKSFIKTIYGKVHLVVLSLADETKTVNQILYGNPKDAPDSCIFDVWSEKQYQVFRRLNESHIKAGRIIEYTRKDNKVQEERTIPEWSDEELNKNILSVPFMKASKIINGLDEIAVVFRLQKLATDLDKPARLVDLITARLAELQGEEYKTE